MFKRSNETPQLDLFENSADLMSGKKLKTYSDPKNWHNQFREQVVNKIDETLFSDLFCKDHGAPNSSIRILIGMMMLKEGNGWSDVKLFEEVSFNLLVRSALGLHNINDNAPVESTYYLLRSRIVEREKSGKSNLIEDVLHQLSKDQAFEFHLPGKKVRMDSKLIGSNIVWASRYEIIHETLRVNLHENTLFLEHLSESEKSIIEEVANNQGAKITYRCDKNDIQERIALLGGLLYKILSHPNNEKLLESTIGQVFRQQYSVEEKEKSVLPRPKEEIGSDSIQSPHDPECHYRDKDGNKVKGYSVNVTESCDENALHLITDVKVKPVSYADCNFFKPSVEDSNKVLSNKIDEKKHRYFTLNDLNTCKLRREIAQIPQDELNKRNNVEATIYHFGHRYPHDKTRYRGMSKHVMWANLRCMWVNFTRIVKYLGKIFNFQRISRILMNAIVIDMLIYGKCNPNSLRIEYLRARTKKHSSGEPFFKIH